VPRRRPSASQRRRRTGKSKKRFAIETIHTQLGSIGSRRRFGSRRKKSASRRKKKSGERRKKETRPLPRKKPRRRRSCVARFACT
jgi:hypothetical protein